MFPALQKAPLRRSRNPLTNVWQTWAIASVSPAYTVNGLTDQFMASGSCVSRPDDFHPIGFLALAHLISTYAVMRDARYHPMTCFYSLLYHTFCWNAANLSRCCCQTVLSHWVAPHCREMHYKRQESEQLARRIFARLICTYHLMTPKQKHKCSQVS